MSIMQERWLLPEGIEEVLPPAARRLEALRRELLDLYDGWGYDLVMTPFIEYLESLLTGTGNDLELHTFKVTDQLSGRMMGVRADMTPQVARIDAHHLQRQGPSRLCYMGTVLRTRSDGLGGSRSPLQIGAELYGHGGYESDLEIVSLMLETLRVAGVAGVHLDLGHVAIFRSLVRDAGLDPATERALFDALQRKAVTEIGAILDEAGIHGVARERLAALVELNGGAEVLDEARLRLSGAGSTVDAALETLGQMVAGIGARAPGVPLHIDLAELRGYHYHTGVVYAAYVPGRGQAVAQGGRYDEIGAVFGRSRPATGFSADLKTLLLLGGRALPTRQGIYAPDTADAALEAAIEQLRAAGQRVVRALPGSQDSAQALCCDRQLILTDTGWTVAAA